MAEHVSGEEWQEAKSALGALICMPAYVGIVLSFPVEALSWFGTYSYPFWIVILISAALMVLGVKLGAKVDMDPRYVAERDERIEAEKLRAAKRAAAEKDRFDPIYVLDWQDAERSARDFLRHQGHTDAQLTPPGADGGVDVVSSAVIAQVKYQTRPVGAPAVVQLLGTTHRKKYQDRSPYFFSSSGYTAKAVTAARELGVTLYQLHGSRHWKQVR
ncbi:restriction endonuclease [Kocuria oceani]|uniref:restriction endonuclease n=1 Tax=Kocuria oceani TaxID=988827 RepID=UPI00403729C0